MKRIRTVLAAAAAGGLATLGLAVASPAAHATTYPAESPSFGKANLLSADDSDFENGTGTWVSPASGGNSTVTQDTVHSYLHADSLLLTATASGSDAAQGLGAPNDNVIPVTAGDVYRLSGWVRTGSAVTGRTVTWSAEFRDSTGAIIGNRDNATTQTLASSAKWQYVSGTLTAPSGAVDLAFPRITEAGVSASEALNVDEVMILPYRAATVIGAKDPSTDGSSYSTMNSAIGPSQVDKEFYGGSLPSSYSSSNCANLPSTITCVEAYKTPDTNVASFTASIPAGRNTILVFHQEPEGDTFANGPDGCSTGTNGGNFVCEAEAQSALIRGATTSSNVENVFFADDSSGYNYGTGRVGADCSYTVPTAYVDMYFMDHYENPADGSDSQSYGTAENRSEFTNWIGCVGPQNKPVGFGEYGLNCPTTNTPDAATTYEAMDADNTLLEGQSFTGTTGGTSAVTYNLPVMDWMYWWYNNDGVCQFTTGGSPDGTQAVQAWQSAETQNGGGAN